MKFLVTLCTTLMFPIQLSAATLVFSCQFDRFYDAGPDELSKTKDFGLRFVLDTQTGQAFMEGNNGAADVVAVGGSDANTFLERLSNGVVQSTTISIQGTAVHSRHTIIAGELVPSQYYGFCER